MSHAEVKSNLKQNRTTNFPDPKHRLIFMPVPESVEIEDTEIMKCGTLFDLLNCETEESEIDEVSVLEARVVKNENPIQNQPSLENLANLASLGEIKISSLQYSNGMVVGGSNATKNKPNKDFHQSKTLQMDNGRKFSKMREEVFESLLDLSVSDISSSPRSKDLAFPTVDANNSFEHNFTEEETLNSVPKFSKESYIPMVKIPFSHVLKSSEESPKKRKSSFQNQSFYSKDFIIKSQNAKKSTFSDMIRSSMEQNSPSVGRVDLSNSNIGSGTKHSSKRMENSPSSSGFKIRSYVKQ